MNRTLSKILKIVAFVILALIVPTVLVILFTRNSSYVFEAFLITFVVVIFSIQGYIIFSIRDTSKIINDAVEEMKMQNAAIAYKLTGGVNVPVVNEEPVPQETEEEKPKKVNLNPDDPLDFK